MSDLDTTYLLLIAMGLIFAVLLMFQFDHGKGTDDDGLFR